MSSYNRVILLGNSCFDVEMRYTSGGTAVTDIRLAVNDKRKDQQGKWVEETTYVDVTLWGRTAEVAGEYLAKGAPVLIEGRLKLDTWEKGGQKQSKLKVVAERMQLLGGKSDGGRSQKQSSGERPPAERPDAGQPVDDGEIPF